jgi:hypothetical protein
MKMISPSAAILYSSKEALTWQDYMHAMIVISFFVQQKRVEAGTLCTVLQSTLQFEYWILRCLHILLRNPSE